MKYIFKCLFISILGFLNIWNCFAGSVDWNLKGTFNTLIIPIAITIVGLLIYHWFFLPVKEIDDDREQEFRSLHSYDRNIVNQLVKNYLNSYEGRKLIEDTVRSYLKKEGKALLEPSVSKKIPEKKEMQSFQKPQITEQRSSINNQIVNRGYTEKNPVTAPVHSESAQPPIPVAEQAAIPETRPVDSNILQVVYARETNNSFILRDIKDTYQKGKSLYKLTIYRDNITARIEPLLDRDEVKQRALNDEGKLLEPICEIEKASDKPKDIKLISSGSAKFEDGNWVVDDKHKIRIKFE